MIGRRKVLKFLGITPLAAKATAEKAAMELTAIGGPYKSLAVGIHSEALYGAPANDSAMRYDRMSDFVRTHGKLPSHVTRAAWQEAKFISHLDHDLAALKSWSLAAKVHEQRQRNFKRKMDEYRDAGWYYRGAKLFKETMGFDWSW